jgi:hypothetical protein
MHCRLATIESRVPLPVDKYGDVLKIVQIVFYTIAGIVAILTYLAARRGLLNTVNTEYQTTMASLPRRMLSGCAGFSVR